MTIQSILEKLPDSEKPIVQILHKHNDAKVLAIAFKRGMVLKEHKAQVDGKLLCIAGKVVYIEGNNRFEINKFQEKEITAFIPHSVEAIDDSICIICL